MQNMPFTAHNPVPIVRTGVSRQPVRVGCPSRPVGAVVEGHQCVAFRCGGERCASVVNYFHSRVRVKVMTVRVRVMVKAMTVRVRVGVTWMCVE